MLTVENGTGLSNAESYLSLSEANAYHTAHSGSTAWSQAQDADKERALRLATQYLDVRYGTKFSGIRICGTQALLWPRMNVVDNDGYYLLSNEVPAAIKNACAEAALRVINGDNLFADQDEPGTIASESVKVGSIEQSTTYIGGRSQTKKYPIIDGLVRPLCDRADQAERC